MNGLLSYRSVLFVFLASTAVALYTGSLLVLAVVPALIVIVTGLIKPSIVFFLLLFTIPLSTEYQFNSTLGTDIPDEALMWFLTPLIIFMLFRNREMMGRILQNRILVLILISLFWTLITVLLSENPVISLKFLAAKIWYIVPFVIGAGLFLKQKKDHLLAAHMLLLPMLFTVIVILIRHGSEGFSFESVNDVTLPFFRNHVNYGALLVCMIPLAWGLYRAGYRFWLFGLVILLTGLFFSYSRGAWLALGSALIVVYFIRKNALQWLIGLVVALVLVGAAWFLDDNRYLQYRPQYEKTIYHASFDEHMAATYRLQDMSTIERFYRWIAAVKMAKEDLVTGTGPNRFYPLYKSHVANDFRTYVSDNPEKSTVHNYFLLLLTEQGLPGMLLFTVLFIMMLMTVQKIYHNNTDRHTRGLMLVIGAVLGMTGVLIFLSDLIETDKIGSIFYLCAGVLLDRKIERE